MNYYDTRRNGAILYHSNIENCAQNIVGWKDYRQNVHSDMISFIQRLKFKTTIVEAGFEPSIRIPICDTLLNH